MRQDRLDPLHVHGLAAVAGAHECQVFALQPEMGQPARTQEGQHLQRLQRRAREGQPARVARVRQHAPPGVGHRQRAEVDALQGAAAQEVDEGNQVGHAAIIPAAVQPCTLPAAAQSGHA
jgi:hypothetical protein